MYCLKCKRITGNEDVEKVMAKNNRHIHRGKFAECGTTKTQFIKLMIGKGRVNDLTNNLPFEMHLSGHNFIIESNVKSGHDSQRLE